MKTFTYFYCRGKVRSYAYTVDSHTCPNNTGLTWMYLNGTSWLSAGGGLRVTCKDSAELSKFTQKSTEVVIIGVLAGVVVVLIGVLLYSSYKIHIMKKATKVYSVKEYL